MRLRICIIRPESNHPCAHTKMEDHVDQLLNIHLVTGELCRAERVNNKGARTAQKSA